MDDAEYEPTTAEMAEQLRSNVGMRYLIVGEEDLAQQGRALIYDTIMKSWVGITSPGGDDKLHRDLIVEMLKNGTPLYASLP